MKKNFFLFLILCTVFFACSKEYETITSDNLTEEKQSVTFQRNSEKENDYYVANFVSPENVGLHHTSCVRYVMDNLKKRNETPSDINDFLTNGQVLLLFDEYRELNGLPTISLPNYSAPETYQEFLDQNDFSLATENLLTSSFEVFDNYSTTDSMFSELDQNLEIANTFTNEYEKNISIITINVLKSSLDVWIKQAYNSFLPDNISLVAYRIKPNDVKVLRKDAVITAATTITGGLNPLSFCVGMIAGTGASIGTWMGQHGYDDSWWPF